MQCKQILRQCGSAALLAALCWQGVAQAASFDCAKAGNKVEKLICAKPELSQLDEQLSSSYKALQQVPGAPELREKQQSWIKQRNRCKDAACVGYEYKARLEAMASLQKWLDSGRFAHNAGLMLYLGESGISSHLFDDSEVQDGLRAILQNRYKAYRDFLQQAGSDTVHMRGDYLTVDRSQLHVGGYNSTLFINMRDGTFSLFWLNDTVREGKPEFFGVEPVPPAVLQMVADDMNQGWGHVAKFSIKQGRLQITPQK